MFDLGDGRELRRFIAGGDAEREAMVMRHASAHGYPVPKVLEVRDGELILELITGPSMRERADAAMLADLHARLHAIVAPPELPSAGPGDRLIHLDLHPENVILSADGPVVIDWTNACRGSPALDVAMTYLLCTVHGGEPGRELARAFVTFFDLDELREAMSVAAELRCADRNVTQDERDAARAVALP